MIILITLEKFKQSPIPDLEEKVFILKGKKRNRQPLRNFRREISPSQPGRLFD
jgi:hypothetical protein